MTTGTNLARICHHELSAPIGTTPAGFVKGGMFIAHAIQATLDGRASQWCVRAAHVVISYQQPRELTNGFPSM